MLKMAVFAPMPIASDRTAIAANPGLRRKLRRLDQDGPAVERDDRTGDAAESEQRRAPGFFRRQPLLDVVLSGFVDVRGYLIAQVVIHLGASAERTHAGQQHPQAPHDCSS